MKKTPRPKQALHWLNEDGMVACNPRDREAAHRAEMEGIATHDVKAVTCSKCLAARGGARDVEEESGAQRGRAEEEPMTEEEEDFWLSLEYRLCDELSELPEETLRSLWCDGIVPDRYLFGDAAPRITGPVWLVQSRGTARVRFRKRVRPRGRAGRRARALEIPESGEWEFTLVLPRSVAARADIDWSSLLPAEDSHGWLTLDWHAQQIRIEPAVTSAGTV